jgi:FAD/FMN-containing dehydrogenase
MSTRALLTRRGDRVAFDATSFAAMRARLQGTTLEPGDAGYDAARSIWNGMIRRHPALIVRCDSAADVAHAVRFVRENDLVFSVRSGGHNIAGTSLCDGGVVIDLSGLKGVHVDARTGRVRVEAGCTLGDVDRETQRHGLAVPTGIVSETGIAGLTVGGGFGWLTRKHGYTSDNLLSADVVLADGSTVSASADENADLFWGIRGGGGNFAIVTSFEFQAYPLGPDVVAGMVVWPIEQAPEVMAFYRSFSATLPEDAGSLLVIRPAPPAPFLPPEAHGKLIVGIAGMYAGPIDEGERVFAPVRAFGRPLGGGIVPKPFTAHQTMFDAGQPKGRRYYWKSEYLEALSGDTDRILLTHGRLIESPHTAILCFQLGGAMARVPEDASAAGHRKAGFVVNVAGAWDDPAETERHTAWVRSCWEELRPHSTGTYVNFLTQEDGDDRVRAAYGANYDRLAALKARFDPDNVLRANQNIAPRVAAASVAV